MNHRVALSYAGEDRYFVEHVAGILERFLGKDAVFYYTNNAQQTRQGIVKFLQFINGQKVQSPPTVQKVYMAVFTHQVNGKSRIVQGQRTELCDPAMTVGNAGPTVGHQTWQSITNASAPGVMLKTFAVLLPTDCSCASDLNKWNHEFVLESFGRDREKYTEVTDIDRSSAEHLAEFLLRDILDFGPRTHYCKAFTYEKDILRFYAKLYKVTDVTPFTNLPDKERHEFEGAFKSGVPMVWPTIRLRTDYEVASNSLLRKYGKGRAGIQNLKEEPDREKIPDEVVVAALSELQQSAMRFLEAGPRDRIAQFNPHPKVGILVSGGIAPGINAVIDGIVRRHEDYDSKCTVYGFKNGLHALNQNANALEKFMVKLSSSSQEGKQSTSEHVSRGGSFLGTFRLSRLDTDAGQKTLEKVIINLEGLDVLYVIGGDGSMKAANLLTRELRRRGKKLSVVGIPKTMDNDILWVWQSFGFATAVEKAREVIACISTEVKSNPRIMVVQLFGSVSGFVVSHAVLAGQSGDCDAALIPEASFTISKLAKKIKAKFADSSGKVDPAQLPSGMIVMAETAIPDDAADYVDEAELTPKEKEALAAYLEKKGGDENYYIEGQTTDVLRSAGLKVVLAGLQKKLKPLFNIDPERERFVFSNEPRHILRATNPSFSDIIFGQRLGGLAVDNAMAGYSDFMVSQWLTEYVLVPLRLVALGRKRIKRDGIFWKSVLAKTGQGELV